MNRSRRRRLADTLVTTESGVALRHRSGLGELGELNHLRSAIVKAAGAASEGWKLLDEFSEALDEGRPQRPATVGPASDVPVLRRTMETISKPRTCCSASWPSPACSRACCSLESWSRAGWCTDGRRRGSRRLKAVSRPTLARVNGILDTLTTLNGILGDLQKVTATVRNETERVDLAINRTIERVDDTADRVRTNVRAKTSRLIGLVRGARVALESILQSA